MSKNGKFRAVLFDMDETLVQHQKTGIELIHEIFVGFRDRLPDIEEQLFATTLWRKANDMWNMMFDGVLPGEVARPYTFKNTLRELNADTNLAVPMMDAFDQAVLDSTRLTPGAVTVLEALRQSGIPTGVVTNGFTSAQTRKAEFHGLHKLTDFVLPSEKAGAHKPNPAIFGQALEMIERVPHESIMIGDNLVADIRGALDAGLSAALFDPQNRKESDLNQPDAPRPTLILRDMDTLLSHLGF